MSRNPIPEYTNSKIISLIDEYIHNDRDRDILKRRLVDGWTYERIAEEFGLSDKRTKSIIYKSQEKLFKHI